MAQTFLRVLHAFLPTREEPPKNVCVGGYAKVGLIIFTLVARGFSCAKAEDVSACGLRSSLSREKKTSGTQVISYLACIEMSR